MRSLVLTLAMVLVGCAADEDSTIEAMDEVTTHETKRADSKGDEAGPDLCALAAELPADDICRNLCDPDAVAAQLEADGADRGACYTLYCQLTESAHAIVGVCLAP